MSNCINCLLPEGKLHVHLDGEGVCNYCHRWEADRERFTDYESLLPLLNDRIEKLRDRGPHDVLVGYSGGKDSTFVAHALVHRYNLKPLLMTINNGFLNDYAKQNIATMIDKLGLDHFFHHFDADLQRRLYRAAYETYADPCVGCAIPVYYYTIKFAYENRIPMIVHGRTPYQIFRNYHAESKDTFLALHLSNYEPHSPGRLAEIYQGFAEQLRHWSAEMFPGDAVAQQEVYEKLFFDVSTADPDRLPDFIGLFQYEPYDEEAIKTQMAAAVGYKRPPGDSVLGHGDCDIHAACSFVMRSIRKEVSTLTEIAAMVRHGAIDRETAGALIARYEAVETKRPTDAISAFCHGAGISVKRFNDVVASAEKRGVMPFANH